MDSLLFSGVFDLPWWSHGVINGIGHYWGYRHWSSPDASTNIVPVGIRSAASREQLVTQLQDWCRRAEASGIVPLSEFARQLRSYA